MNDFSNELMKDINNELKEEVAFLLEDGSPSDVKTFIPTGSTLLDYIISNKRNGGIPVGKITEIAGLEGTGKTLLGMQICANTQKMGGIPVFIDSENAFNSDFARRVGLNPFENFMYVRPASIEDVFKIIFKLIHRLDKQEKANNQTIPFVTIVWDSVASTPTQADLEAENPDPGSTVGLKPRILSKNIYTLLRTVGRKHLALVFTNQLRMNIKALPFTDPYVTPGGKAIPFAASARIRLFNTGKVKANDQFVGINVKGKCEKTRFGPPYRECKFPLYFTHGVDDIESIMDILEANDVLKKKRAGPKGTLYYFEKDGVETGLKRIELKQKIRKDQKLQNFMYDLLEKIMVRPMVDPASVELEIVDDVETI